MAATETLNRSRSVQFNIHLDREALMNALEKPSKNKKREDSDVEEKEETTKRVLKRMRAGEL